MRRSFEIAIAFIDHLSCPGPQLVRRRQCQQVAGAAVDARADQVRAGDDDL